VGLGIVHDDSLIKLRATIYQSQFNSGVKSHGYLTVTNAGTIF